MLLKTWLKMPFIFWYNIIIAITVSDFLWGLFIDIMTVSRIYYLLFMTKNKYHNCGCILPMAVVDVTICYIDTRFSQNTPQTVIGGELKLTPAFINVSAGRR